MISDLKGIKNSLHPIHKPIEYILFTQNRKNGSSRFGGVL